MFHESAITIQIILTKIRQICFVTKLILHSSCSLNRPYVVSDPRKLVSVTLTVWIVCQNGGWYTSQCLRVTSTMHGIHALPFPLENKTKHGQIVLCCILFGYRNYGWKFPHIAHIYTLHSSCYSGKCTIFSLFIAHSVCHLEPWVFLYHLQ